jgi:hypothetical protein
VRRANYRGAPPPQLGEDDGGEQGMGRGQSVTWIDVARNGLHAKSSEVVAERQDQDLSNPRGSCACGPPAFVGTKTSGPCPAAKAVPRCLMMGEILRAHRRYRIVSMLEHPIKSDVTAFSGRSL